MPDSLPSAEQVAKELRIMLGVIDVYIPECRNGGVERMLTDALTSFAAQQRAQARRETWEKAATIASNSEPITANIMTEQQVGAKVALRKLAQAFSRSAQETP